MEFFFLHYGQEGVPWINCSNVRLYSCKIYEGSTLIADYIPVKDSSNKGCLYDLVSKTFKRNVSPTTTAGFSVGAATGSAVSLNNKATPVNTLYVGVGGVAKRVKKGYVGVGGVAKCFYNDGAIQTFSSTVIPTSGWTKTSDNYHFSATNSYGTWSIESTVTGTTQFKILNPSNSDSYSFGASTSRFEWIVTAPSNIKMKINTMMLEYKISSNTSTTAQFVFSGIADDGVHYYYAYIKDTQNSSTTKQTLTLTPYNAESSKFYNQWFGWFSFNGSNYNSYLYRWYPITGEIKTF